MKPILTLSIVIVAYFAGEAAQAQAHTRAPGERLDCMIQPHRDVQIGSPSAGVIAEVLVQRGEIVEQGQVLARLQSDVERAALAVARERAAQVGEEAVANSSRNLAARELERANELFGQQYVSRTYLDKQRAEAQAALGRTTQAIENRRLAKRQLQLAQTQLEQRTIRAPFSGVVVERFLETGEYVDQKPVLRLAATDPLRVDVLVPARSFGQIATGQAATVYPEMNGAAAKGAAVVTVDRMIDAASNTFRVRLRLPNEDQSLPAGLRCAVSFERLQTTDSRQSIPGITAQPKNARRG